MAEGGAVGVKVIPDFTGFGSLFSGGIRGALTQAEGMGKQLSAALGGGMKTGLVLVGAAAAIAITDFVAKGVQQYSRLAETTRELDAITGASAERTSLFAGVLKNLGVNAASAARPLGLLANNIQNHTDLFAKYGVQIAHTASGQADLLGTLENLRKSFSGSADATARDAAAKALLGRGFQTLIPYLELSNTQLKQFQDIARRSGAVFTQADVDNARQMAVNVAQAKSAIQSVEIVAGRGATTGINNLFSGLNVLSKTGAGDLPRVFGNLLTGGIVELPDHIKNAVSAENDLSRSAQQTQIDLANEAAAADSLGTAIEGIHSAEEGVHSAQEGVQHAAQGIVNAQRGVRNAHEGALHASESLATAEQNLNDLYRTSAEGSDAVAHAQLGVIAADLGVRDATESLADATKNLTELQQFAAQDSAHELTDAHLSLAGATLSLAEARRNLATVHPTAQDPYASQRARLGVQQAVENQKKAQEALAKTTQFGTSADKALTDAQRAARDASERLTTAFQAQDDARTALHDAEVAFDRQEMDLQRAVRDARIGVRDAVEQEHSSEQALADAKQSYADSEQTLTDAKIKLRDANDKVNQALDDEAAKGVNLNAVLDTLKAKYPELAGIIEQFYGRVTAARQADAQAAMALPPNATTAPLPGMIPGLGGASSRPPPLGELYPPPGAIYNPVGTRAGGGAVYPGQAYLVGEQGPEILQDGRVYPRGQAPPTISTATGDTYNFHLNGPVGSYAEFEQWITKLQNKRRKATRGRQ
jgi:hypothetical protein